MEILIDEIKRYELALMAGLMALAVVVYAVKSFRNRKKRKRSGSEQEL
jgi:hypothetical protein